MKPEIKQRWVEALRSGEYQQGRQILRAGDKFCCLGVLCDLAAKDGVVRWKEDRNLYFFPARGGRQVIALPPQVMEWAGLDHPDPRAGERALSWHNDSDGKNFLQIADLIEEHL